MSWRRWKHAWALAALGMLLLGVGLLFAQAKGEKKTITGEVIDITSFVTKGSRGEAEAEAGKFRAEKGFPAGILESSSGQIYLAVYRNPAPASALETANEKLAPLMGKEVVIQGKVFEQAGVRLVEINLVGEM